MMFRRGVLSSVYLSLVMVSLMVATPLCAQSSFHNDVRHAIDRGVSFLYKQVGRRERTSSLDQMYPLGTRALSAYSLLEAGSSPESKEIRKLFKEMQRLRLKAVYSVSLYVMALDAYKRKRGEKASKDFHDSLRRSMLKCLQWLEKNRVPGSGVWGYGLKLRPFADVRGWVDFSNTQFAVLAFQVGIHHGLEISSKVLEKNASRWLSSAITLDRESIQVPCEGAGWWEDHRPGKNSPVIFSSSGFTLRVTPLEWGYTPSRRRNLNVRPSYSMTAAGTSSLMVARTGLARAGELSDELRDSLDRAIAGGLATLARDWNLLSPTGGANVHRNYYYTLYSFEKAMDLGGIQLLNGVDWYREQALKLLQDQREDGAWGGPAPGFDPDFDRVSTGFAMLFLNRVTRHLRLTPLDPILTTAGGKSVTEEGLREGRIFLPSEQGVVELSQLFDMLGSARTSNLVKLGREAMESAPPHELPELLPYLARVRNGSGDAVDDFAEESIYRISGLVGHTSSEEITAWLGHWRSLREWGHRNREDRIPSISLILGGEFTSPPLRIAAIEALVRIGSLEAVPELLKALESLHPEVRESAHRALQALTPGRIEYAAHAGAPRRAEGVARWQEYWLRNKLQLRFQLQWERLRMALNSTQDAGERMKLRERIIALGARVLPEVSRILARDEYAFDWILIREAITGEKTGF